MSEIRSSLIRYISGNVGELNKNERVEILKLLLEHVKDDRILEKGDGTQIDFDEIKTNVLEQIKLMIVDFMAKKQKEMNEMMKNVTD